MSADHDRTVHRPAGNLIRPQLDEPIVDQNPRAWLHIARQVLIRDRNINHVSRFCGCLGAELSAGLQ